MSDPHESHPAATHPRYGDVDTAYARRLATTPPADDGPVWMVNLMKYRRRAVYADGRPTTITGRQADDLYSPIAELAAVGADVVFFAEVELQLLGEPIWDRVAVVRYPTRRSFFEMQSQPDFIDRHNHKDAGMEQTFVLGCQPLQNPDQAPNAPALPDWSDVPHPSTPDDGPVQIVNVVRFKEQCDRDAHLRTAAEVAVPQGRRVQAVMAVDGTIIGDGRQWDHVHFNLYPSKAAFIAFATDPSRLTAQAEHRDTAVAETYAIMTRPTLDTLCASLGA